MAVENVVTILFVFLLLLLEETQSNKQTNKKQKLVLCVNQLLSRGNVAHFNPDQ